MMAAQFRQIVLLPQGEFRKILTANSDERAPILKRLFDVSLLRELHAENPHPSCGHAS